MTVSDVESLLLWILTKNCGGVTSTSASEKKTSTRCGWSESVFKHTYFLYHVHLDIETLLLFIKFYLRNKFSYQTAQEEITGLSYKTM